MEPWEVPLAADRLREAAPGGYGRRLVEAEQQHHR